MFVTCDPCFSLVIQPALIQIGSLRSRETSNGALIMTQNANVYKINLISNVLDQVCLLIV